ncbi:MAG: hypothetical protein CMH83_21025 [Nocardioides sp.]|nr:hypothetical protein [Nocardioides sp.]
MSDDKSKATVERNIYERADGTWGWRLKVNGKIVATDGNQGYENESFCRKMADRVASGFYTPTKKTISRRN